MNYKYKTNFSNPIERSDILNSNFQLNSIASLDNLSELIDENIDFEKNIDLLGVAFNAALINVFNRNGDGIDTVTAEKIKKYFIHKPTNIEHDKKKVVGHIISSAISEVSNNKIIENVNIDSREPMNLSLGAVIYSAANRDFSKLAEESVIPESDKYMKVSASWELGFNDYFIAVGSRNLMDAEIIKEEKHIKELSKYLQCFDGEGRLNDGSEIYRLVAGEVYPLGIGYTSNPAANVKGIHIREDKKKDEEISANTSLKKISKIKSNCSENKKNKKNISQTNNLDVIVSITKISHMEKNILLEDFKTILDEKIPDHGFSQETVANVGRVIGDAIKSKSDQYEKELSELEDQRVKISEAEIKMQSDVEELKSELESSQAEIESLKGEIESRKKEDAFNSRMESISSEYDLSKEDSKLLASEIKSVGLSDQEFEDYKSKLEVMWAHKNKEYIKTQEEAFEKRVQDEILKISQSQKSETESQPLETSEASTVSEEDTVEQALDQVEENSESISNNNSNLNTEEDGIREKFAKAFSKENLTIKI